MNICYDFLFQWRQKSTNNIPEGMWAKSHCAKNHTQPICWLGHAPAIASYVPILLKFLHAMTEGGVECPSGVVSGLLTHILDVCRAPYPELPPPTRLLPPTVESELSFSHNIIFELGRETMLLTTCWKTNTLHDSCWKLSYDHPSLHFVVLMAYVMVWGGCITKYSLNREPNIFANTLFVVDRL